MEEKIQQHKSISAAHLRRINKPVMEKKRRQRINNCLTQLKSLVLDATNKDPARYSKLEKADILEMTVKHLRAVQRQHLAVAASSDPTVMAKYRSGFSECSKEISRYLGTIDGVAQDVKGRVMNHLGNCETQMDPIVNPFSMLPPRPPIQVQIPNATPMMSLPGSRLIAPQSPPNHVLLTPNGNRLQGTFQLLPGTYSGGHGLTVFLPSPPADKSLSSVPVSPMSLQSDVSPISSPEPETKRHLTAAERKCFPSPSRNATATRSSLWCPPALSDNLNNRTPHRNPHPIMTSTPRASLTNQNKTASSRKECPEPSNHVIRDINHNEVAVKEEPVWRPW